MKRFMREQTRSAGSGGNTDDGAAQKLGGRELRALGKLMPGEEEVAENPRAVVQCCVSQRGRTHDRQSDRGLKQG